jgi:hypothetical protein
MTVGDPRSAQIPLAPEVAAVPAPQYRYFGPAYPPRRPTRPPLSLFASPRRIVTYCAAFVVFGGISAPIGAAAGRMAASLLSSSDDADFTYYANSAMAASLVLFLGGLWWWADASMLRRGTGVVLRGVWTILIWIATVTLVGTSVLAIILLTLLFGNPDALTWMGSFVVTLVVMSLAAVPAVIVGELVGGTPQHPDRGQSEQLPYAR